MFCYKLCSYMCGVKYKPCINGVAVTYKPCIKGVAITVSKTWKCSWFLLSSIICDSHDYILKKQEQIFEPWMICYIKDVVKRKGDIESCGKITAPHFQFLFNYHKICWWHLTVGIKKADHIRMVVVIHVLSSWCWILKQKDYVYNSLFMPVHAWVLNRISTI